MKYGTDSNCGENRKKKIELRSSGYKGRTIKR